MEVTQKDGRVVHPREICVAKKCPHPTSARLVDLTESHKPRKDMCAGHAVACVRVYKDKVEVIAAWNELKMEDFE